MENFVKKSGIYMYTGAPHTLPSEKFDPREFWKEDKSALAVMWSSDFDTDVELPWWFCIIDHTFSFDDIKSKRRTEIRKACRRFDVRKIDAAEYADTMANICHDVWQDYSVDYRPNRSIEALARIYCNHAKDKRQHYFGCFNAESGELVGFANCYVHDEWIDFRSMKTNEECKNGGGALAIVYAICTEYMAVPGDFRYVCDGQRNIVHQTNFQEFLVSKFGWRYARARLNVRYRPMIGLVVKLLYPFRKSFLNAQYSIFRKMGTLLRYEEISRECQTMLKVN